MKKEEKVKVVLVKPKERPEVLEVENELESYQKLVDGYIELVRTNDPSISMLVNEEGRLLDLPMNRNIGGIPLVGNVVFVKTRGEEFASLSEKEINMITSLIDTA